MNGPHLWHRVEKYEDAFTEKITVIDERNIIFPPSIDTLRLVSIEKSSGRLIFAGGEIYSLGKWDYDTIIYDSRNTVLFWNWSFAGSGGSSAGHWRTW